MNVLYTCDNNYVWIMGVSVISLFEENTSCEYINVYLLGQNIQKENKEILNKIAEKYGRNISIIDVTQLDVSELLISDRWPKSAFFRLYCGDFLPTDVEKVLYLDCDTIIVGEIELIESVDMFENVICGVRDCIGRRYKENIGLDANSLYVNGGVLLIDVAKLRKMNINSVINQYVEKYKKYIQYADQDILNGAFSGMIGTLDAKYDVMTIEAVYSYEEIMILRNPTRFYTKEEMDRALKTPLIIHYTTNMRIIRPWYKDSNHPYAHEFDRYKKISPWKDKKLEKMIFCGLEKTIIGLMLKLPKVISYRILGCIHSTLKPIYVRMRGCII